MSASDFKVKNNLAVLGTGYCLLPNGTTAQRPASPLAGMTRWNTDLVGEELYDGAAWNLVQTKVPSTPVFIAVYNGVIPAMTGTTRVPFDNNTPVITNGTQLWATTITPKSISSRFRIEFAVEIGASVTTPVAIHLFRGTTAICSITSYAATTIETNSMLTVDAPATISPVTYTCMVGLNAAGTWYINRGTTTQYFNGMLQQNWVITEISQ